MEKSTNRIAGDVQSYELKRKREREALEIKQNEKGLEALKGACEFYIKVYPKSQFGIKYETPKYKKIPEIKFDLTREEALIFKEVLKYFKLERQVTTRLEINIGHARYRVYQCIPDISKILKIEQLEHEKIEIDMKIHELKTRKEEIGIQQEEPKEKIYTCGFCDKEFTMRSEIQEHIWKCPKHPVRPAPEEKEVVPEKKFTCQYCKFEGDINDIQMHIKTCKPPVEEKKEELPEEPKAEVNPYVCELCGKDCTNKGGLGSHMKTHEKEDNKDNE